MSEQEFELYLKLLARCLGLSASQRAQIADELRDHFEARFEELTAAGICREDAVFQTIDEFGDAAVLAADFTHTARLKRRRFLMRLSLGSAAVLAAGLLIAFAFWPENRAIQGPVPVVAQEKPKPVEKKPHAAPEKKHRTEGTSPVQPQKSAAVIDVDSTPVKHPLSSDVANATKIERRIQEALDSPVDFEISLQPLKESLEFISQRFQIPILIDTKSFEEASIDSATEAGANIPGIKLRTLLKLLLGKLPQPVGFEIRDEVLMIETREALESHKTVVVYDCRDLIDTPSVSVQRPSHEIAPIEGAIGSVRKAASSPSDNKTSLADKSPKPQSTRRYSDPDDSLIAILQNASDPEDWGSENGASISEFKGMLIVRQSPPVHEKIKQILSDIRNMHTEGAFRDVKPGGPANPARGDQKSRPKAPDDVFSRQNAT